MIANLASSISRTWPQLLAFRLLLGIGLGINTSTVSVYTAECAPAAIRGGLAVSWQMWTAFGIFLGFVANAAVYKVSFGARILCLSTADTTSGQYGADAWRLQLAAPFIPTVPLVILLYICPESPAWCIKHGQRYRLAFGNLCKFRNSELQAAKEIYATYLQHHVKAKVGNAEVVSFFARISELFTIPRIRRATTGSYVAMLSQQLCGSELSIPTLRTLLIAYPSQHYRFLLIHSKLPCL